MKLMECRRRTEMETKVMKVVEFSPEFEKVPDRHNPGRRQVPKRQAQGRGEKILVVDDQRVWLVLARAILSAGGYQVQVCGHSPDAVLLLKENPDQIDLVVTDLTMPHLDGIELAAELLKINAALPIVLTSAAIVESESPLLQTLGIRAFLPKPWERERLLSVIQQTLATTGRGRRNETPLASS
jgi:CheY-like chemotaxis protein